MVNMLSSCSPTGFIMQYFCPAAGARNAIPSHNNKKVAKAIVGTIFLNILKNAGADFLHCSNRRFWECEFSEDGLNLAGIAKQSTGLPSISVGSVGVDKDFIKLYAGDHQTQTTDLDKLHQKLNNSEFDLIAVGRALLSDPEWANKVQNGQEKDIVPFDKSFVENYV